MIHLVLGETCTQIKDRFPVHDPLRECATPMVEVACHHGFRWYERSSVTEYGWKPRPADAPRFCALDGCDQPISGPPNQRFHSVKCSVLSRTIRDARKALVSVRETPCSPCSSPCSPPSGWPSCWPSSRMSRTCA